MFRFKIQSKQGEKGQSSIEFALTLVFMVVFLLFFIQLALFLGLSNFVHYATFMSARAYLSAGYNDQDSTVRAREVIENTLKTPVGAGTERWPLLRGVGGGDVSGAVIGTPSFAQESWQKGVLYRFKTDLFLYPLSNRSTIPIQLTSESWLGESPSFLDCMGSINEESIIDNGC